MTKARFETVPVESALRPVSLVAREWLTTGYLRLRLSGPQLIGFNSPGADDHVRIFIAPPGVPAPTTPEAWRELDSREYTPLNFGADWVEFDFVVHGDGPGSTWAVTAPIGAAAAIGGPRRSNAIVGTPDAWFLAGDETAIPAISRFLRERDPATTARVLVEVDPANELAPIPTDPRVELTLLVRGTDSLAEALAALQPSDRPNGALLGFVAAEAAIVPVARELLLVRWGLAPESTITKGYWRIDPK
ncbi:MAG TPA: siderophore-interacting protein [Propionicimonas sp.]|nr:siderophore-interacting protein [Propionicimonas sp.]HQA77211.1 siderophore-interacting protein [Propionicimonas sp.]HQD96839.1 siderophore-interacting protein [Propionicimonas sp.]